MDYITDIISQYGLIAIFIIILLEYACFPIASEIVLPFAGALAVQGNISFVLVLLTSVVAGILGSLICYCIGRFGGEPLIEKITRKFPKTRKGLQASYHNFNKYASFAVGITRLIPLCRTYISFIAGACKQTITSFVVSSTIGIVVWNVVLVGLGYALGHNWEIVLIYYDKFKWIILPTVFVLAAAFVIIMVIRWKKSGKSISTDTDKNID